MNIFKVVYPGLPDIKYLDLDIADIEDAEFIALLSRHFVESGLSGWSWNPDRVIAQIRNPNALVIVGRVDDSMIAAAIVEYGGYDAHLNLLAVEPLFQRSGIGSCLVRYIENSAFLEGSLRVRLEVRLGNQGARAFYRSLGYEEVEIKRNYYRGNEAAVCMIQNIQAEMGSSLSF